MSQIKLRRDTYANFTSSNPVLGSGEPAYETDTKKLKIGDGSTAYTQLAYFSSGGGGGTDITATLPLKIDENGVISLEVDGQTIQIVDGKLHANLDELGNELNDLSGRVTANEADILTIQGDVTDLSGSLDGKEDKITAEAPLSLSSSTLELNHGMTITSDGAGFYTSAALIPDNLTNWRRFYDTYDTSVANGPNKFFIIPYKLGQVVKMDYPTNSNRYELFLANIDSAGNIDFIGSTQNIGSNATLCFINKGATIQVSDRFSSYDIYEVSSTSGEVGTYVGSKTPTGVPSNSRYWQLRLTDGILYCESAFNRTDAYANTSRVTTTEAAHIERLSQINAILITDNYTESGDRASNARKFSNYGVYSVLDNSNSPVSIYGYTGNLSTLIESNENLWKPQQALTTNTLSLSIGDGLSVTDGKLTATAQIPSVATTSTAGIVKPDGTTITVTEDGTISSVGGSSTPDNMVTTDTTQTISGVKKFSGQTTFLDNILISDGYGIKEESTGALYLTYSQYSGINIGNVNTYTYIKGKKIKDVDGNDFLTRGNVSAGDNISIENTDTGIKIDSKQVTLTQAEYDALTTKDSNTLYLITDAT